MNWRVQWLQNQWPILPTPVCRPFWNITFQPCTLGGRVHEIPFENRQSYMWCRQGLRRTFVKVSSLKLLLGTLQLCPCQWVYSIYLDNESHLAKPSLLSRSLPHTAKHVREAICDMQGWTEPPANHRDEGRWSRPKALQSLVRKWWRTFNVFQDAHLAVVCYVVKTH